LGRDVEETGVVVGDLACVLDPEYVPRTSCELVASAVLAPRCGVTTTLGSVKSGESVVGSSWKTSSAAPAMVPSLSALYRAISSTMPPRATFMR
jgi:hypothetical protein